MSKLTVFTCLTFFAAIALSQETAAPNRAANPPGMATKIVRVQYGPPSTLARLVDAQAWGVATRFDDDLKVIVLQGDEPKVKAVERAIHELDVPSTGPKVKDIELIVSVIGGSRTAESSPSATVPDDMAPVIKQLRAIFPYKNYQVLSSMLLRSREGAKAANEGVMRNVGDVMNYSHPSSYTTFYESASVSSEQGTPTIHLAKFQFNTRFELPTGRLNGPTLSFNSFGATIITDVDLRQGQRVVVGKANVGDSDSAVFLVLTASLVE